MICNFLMMKGQLLQQKQQSGVQLADAGDQRF